LQSLSLSLSLSLSRACLGFVCEERERQALTRTLTLTRPGRRALSFSIFSVFIYRKTLTLFPLYPPLFFQHLLTERERELCVSRLLLEREREREEGSEKLCPLPAFHSPP